MKTDELFASLDAMFTPDMSSLLKECVEFLVSVDLTDSCEDLIGLVMSSSYLDNQELKDALYSKVHDIFINILLEHTVVVSRDATLQLLLDMAQTLVSVPNFIDQQQVMDTLWAPINNEEKLIALLYIVGLVDEAKVSEVLLRVDSSLFERMREFDDTQESIDKIDKNIIKAIRQYVAYLQSQKITIDSLELVDKDLSFGHDFFAYRDLVLKYIDNKTPYNQAKEILFFLFISKDGFHKPLQTFRDHSDELFSSIDTISRVDVQITRIISDMDLYRAKAS